MIAQRDSAEAERVLDACWPMRSRARSQSSALGLSLRSRHGPGCQPCRSVLVLELLHGDVLSPAWRVSLIIGLKRQSREVSCHLGFAKCEVVKS